MTPDGKQDLQAMLIASLDAISDAVTIFDRALRVVFVNSAAKGYLRAANIEPSAILGREAHEVLPGFAKSEWFTAVDATHADGKERAFERFSPSVRRWTETRVFAHGEFIVAFTRDIADRHAFDMRRSDSLAVLDALLNSTQDAIYVKDLDGRFLAINNAGAGNWSADTVVGRTNFDLMDHATAAVLRDRELEVIRSGKMASYEQEIVRDGIRTYYSITRGPWHDSDGNVAGTVGIGTDITERKRREFESGLLAESGRALAESLDYRTTLQAVANLVTPAIADWCTVRVVAKSGKTETVAVAHVDPAKVEWAKRMADTHPAADDAPAGVPHVIRTGVSELYSNITDDVLIAAARDEEHLAMMRNLGMRSVLIVPMSAHGRTVGAISLTNAESGRIFVQGDVPLIEEMGRRSALAIQHAELFQEATQASRAKSEFLASMSHELRTPLNAIIGYTELLGDEITGPVTPSQKHQLERIRASAGHLLGLINDVLSFSRMEAGAETVSRHRFSVATVLEEAAELVRPMAFAKRLELQIPQMENGEEINTDQLKLRQILVNLLTNAVKFTDAGTISITARIEAVQVFIAVRDTGIGISAEFLRRVFEPFWQVEQQATRRVGGTGLGLSVTRRLARLLGGDVRVESIPGEGTTFTVVLPRGLE